MNKIISTIAFVTMLPGCSIYQAIHAASPVEYKSVHVGNSRTETISVLSYPKMTDNKGSQKIDSFEFVDGYQAASKARIILYLAGDIFTATLSELIFWPLELNVFDGKTCRGTVTYGPDDRVLGYDIKDSKGNDLWVSAPANLTTFSPKLLDSQTYPIQ